MTAVQYLLLFGAIASEVIGTLSLRVAANGRAGFYAAVAVGYVVAFTMLWGSLRLGMPLGIAYGIWAAAGVALTAVASRLLFHEPLTRRMLGGRSIWPILRRHSADRLRANTGTSASWR